LLGGEFPLDAQRAREVFERTRGVMRSALEFAQGIIDVANATMEKAIRVISIERGHDPSEYALVAFGGAGPLHACELATALRIPRVLVPKFPGALSALGIFSADVVKDVSQTVRWPVRSRAEAQASMRRRFAAMQRAGLDALRGEGWPIPSVRALRQVDMRYVGQSYELTVSADGDFVRSFHRAHEQRYGYSDRARPVEVVNLRLRLLLPAAKSPRQRNVRKKAVRRSGSIGPLAVYFRGEKLRAAHLDRALLSAGSHIAGPAVITEYSASTFVAPGWQGRVDKAENILLQPSGNWAGKGRR
jgi:N-methylhydantoinase A